jgi:hypothetical protein
MDHLQKQISDAHMAGKHAQPLAADKVSASFEAALGPMAQKMAAEQGVSMSSARRQDKGI